MIYFYGLHINLFALVSLTSRNLQILYQKSRRYIALNVESAIPWSAAAVVRYPKTITLLEISEFTPVLKLLPFLLSWNFIAKKKQFKETKFGTLKV